MSAGSGPGRSQQTPNKRDASLLLLPRTLPSQRSLPASHEYSNTAEDSRLLQPNSTARPAWNKSLQRVSEALSPDSRPLSTIHPHVSTARL